MPRKSKELDEATPEAIAEAGLAIIGRRGPSELSFRAIAAFLQVSHTTVVRRGGGDLHGLLDLLVDHLALGLPDIAPGALPWAQATEQRFTGLYTLLAAHPGLVLLRGPRPWLGPRLLTRLFEPQVADNVSLGLTIDQALYAYREMYLYTLGNAAMVDYQDPKATRLRVRSSLAAYDPEEHPLLAHHLDKIAGLVTSGAEIFTDGLRRFLASWESTARAQ
ncbi:TetR/AcrR family transcriptional regulator C-terminal domain-containing protein [Nocardia huaxiensis]|uniref:TetR/AcrR family transcriptional regulator C-terminal domain-containing protein n=1 Tax=Nocardia huaxiensis TaxID=2755382 RepID=A0A7D6Z0D8_9NOCA|nr:TetR/AcrR family transcriptional regulator C-terminal domain-containing protein [Nocardia huaxiensis]QLY29346.1 TetR/AcrR family transcriptional regulator C-terminal domain-containing protein [Nocardia huaxiensis]UFS97177.1 TetR/AcrR family transcriptional regulator C-terminal domain-containing protein [Nocardia huaxiensis]